MFFFVLVLLALLRVFLGFVSVPFEFQKASVILSTVVFVSAPIFALYFAAKYDWNVRRAVIFLVAGLFIHLGIGTIVGTKLLHGEGFAAAVCIAIATHVGLVMWCVGLGVLLANLLKDKNLLLPVSLFLAAFDIFLVLTPSGVTKQIVQQMPEALKTVGYSIPKIAATTPGQAPTGGPVHVFAYIGPADFLFMGMFFVALFRFGMRTKQTALWLIPAILVYLLLVAIFPAVPLLVPIGLTVLIVNMPEFKLNKEEKLSTVGALVLAMAIIAGGILFRRARAEPSPPEPGSKIQVRTGSPVPAAPSQPR